MHSQFSIPAGRMAWARPKDGKVEGNTDWGWKGKGKYTETGRENEQDSLSYAIREEELFSKPWGLRLALPERGSLRCPCPALPVLLTTQYCLPVLHKPVLGSVHHKGHWKVKLPTWHSFWRTVPLRTGSWLNKQTRHQLCRGHTTG